MGQTASSPQDNKESKSHPQFKTRDEILQYFNTRVVKLFTVTEIAAFKKRFNAIDLNEPIDDTLIKEALYLDAQPNVWSAVSETIRLLQNFPLFHQSIADSITGFGLLKIIAIINVKRFEKLVNTTITRYDITVTLGLCGQAKESENKIKSTNLGDILKTYDHIEIENIHIPYDKLILLVAWLLTLVTGVATTNCKVELSDTIANWNNFKSSAISIANTISTSALGNANDIGIPATDILNAFNTIMISLVPYMSNLFEHLLFGVDDLIDHVNDLANLSHQDVLTPSLYAQVIIGLPNSVTITKLQKLYVGKESGFSMRSLQSKVFRWKAPTLMIVSGTRISDDESYADSKNPRYRSFLYSFPKLRENDQNLDAVHMTKKKVTYAVYIDEPWKVSNKEKFGATNMTIMELTPQQKTYQSCMERTMYFNTIGGGIGVGSEQPIVKQNDIKFIPGNISLTMDSSLEFGVFRHVGAGGGFKTSLLDNDDSKSFEIRFIIQNVEVWGCGGEKELAEQLKQLEWEEAEAKRRQTINLQSLSEDKALLEMVGLVGQHQSGGSV